MCRMPRPDAPDIHAVLRLDGLDLPGRPMLAILAKPHGQGLLDGIVGGSLALAVEQSSGRLPLVNSFCLPPGLRQTHQAADPLASGSTLSPFMRPLSSAQGEPDEQSGGTVTGVVTNRPYRDVYAAE